MAGRTMITDILFHC